MKIRTFFGDKESESHVCSLYWAGQLGSSTLELVKDRDFIPQTLSPPRMDIFYKFHHNNFKRTLFVL
jgi:hypothetical protein